MSNHNLPGHRRAVVPEDNEPSWRPQDLELDDERVRSARDDRDPDAGEPRDARRWESDEDWFAERPDLRAAGSYRELGPDAGIASGPDPTRRDAWRHASGDGHRGRDFERERRELSGIDETRTGYPRGDERIGEPAGSYGHRERVHHGTGSHRGKGPASYCTDDRIRNRVCESLTDDDEIDASDITVSVTGGEVTLSGTVDDRRAKRGAEDCAYGVMGVRDVQNRLRVRDDRASRSNPSSDPAVCSDDSSAQDRKHRA